MDNEHMGQPSKLLWIGLGPVQNIHKLIPWQLQFMSHTCPLKSDNHVICLVHLSKIWWCMFYIGSISACVISKRKNLHSTAHINVQEEISHLLVGIILHTFRKIYWRFRFRIQWQIAAKNTDTLMTVPVLGHIDDICVAVPVFQPWWRDDVSLHPLGWERMDGAYLLQQYLEVVCLIMTESVL